MSERNLDIATKNKIIMPLVPICDRAAVCSSPNNYFDERFQRDLGRPVPPEKRIRLNRRANQRYYLRRLTR